jgi:Fic family protein
MSNASRIINPDRTKPWNDLPDLPPKEERYQDIELFKSLGRAKEQLGLLNGRSMALPDPGLLVNTIALQESKASSEVENIFTTEDDLYRAYSEDKDERGLDPSAKEVLRYREAIWTGQNLLNEQQEFSTDYFIELYRVINDATDGIRPDFSRTVVKQSGTGPNAGKVKYTPPRGDGIVEKKLAALVQFLNSNDLIDEPLLKMIFAHSQFEAIHPFRDGNGRVGRILNLHILTKENLLEYPILYISRYINRHKDEYYENLAEVSQSGNWKSLLLFMLRAVEHTAREAFIMINDIIEAHNVMLNLMMSKTDIRKPNLLADAIFRQPYTKVSHLTDAGIYSENTARNYLNKIAAMNLVEKKMISGRYYYLNNELISILGG